MRRRPQQKVLESAAPRKSTARSRGGFYEIRGQIGQVPLRPVPWRRY